MSLLAVFASLVVNLGLSARLKDQLGECPTMVAQNPKQDCIDSGTNMIVASNCCDDLRWCGKEVWRVANQYIKIIEVYQSTCALLESDVKLRSDGKFEVVDNTRICEPKCTATLDFQIDLPDYQSLESKCFDYEAEEINHIKQRDDLVSALDDARISCTTTVTTTTSSTTTPQQQRF